MQGKIHTLLTENRMCLFGISLLLIFFRHTFFYNQYSFGVFNYISQIGDVGVDVFMFLSAYGLSFSYRKNRDKYHFYKKRLFRILPSVIILLFIFAICDEFFFDAKIYHPIDPRYWFFSLYSTYWFIGAILSFYFAFPFLYELIEGKNWNQLGIVCVAFLIAYSCIVAIKLSHVGLFQQLIVYVARLPILVIGVLMAINGVWKQSVITICFICSIPMVYLLPKDFQRISYSLLTVGLIYYIPLLLNITPNRIKKLISYLGTTSLEFYLIHIYLLKNNALGFLERYLHYQILTSLVILAFVIIMAIGSNKLIGLLNYNLKRA